MGFSTASVRLQGTSLMERLLMSEFPVIKHKALSPPPKYQHHNSDKIKENHNLK